jgi:hypothetical protein
MSIFFSSPHRSAADPAGMILSAEEAARQRILRRQGPIGRKPR